MACRPGQVEFWLWGEEYKPCFFRGSTMVKKSNVLSEIKSQYQSSVAWKPWCSFTKWDVTPSPSGCLFWLCMQLYFLHHESEWLASSYDKCCPIFVISPPCLGRMAIRNIWFPAQMEIDCLYYLWVRL
jgi:hypothetical protein